jgi:hypothetical protein
VRRPGSGERRGQAVEVDGQDHHGDAAFEPAGHIQLGDRPDDRGSQPGRPDQTGHDDHGQREHDHLVDTGHDRRQGERELASQRDRRLVGGALNRGTYTSWDYQHSVNDALRYVRSRADLYELQKNARLDPAGT